MEDNNKRVFPKQLAQSKVNVNFPELFEKAWQTILTEEKQKELSTCNCTLCLKICPISSDVT